MEKLKEIFDQLDRIADLFPCHVYWLDRNNIYQGCNELQAKTLGLNSKKEIIGKSNYNLFNPKNLALASLFDKNNLKVIESGDILIVEEPVFIDKNIQKIFLSYKIPLRDDDGSVVGLLGISFDINERKIAENKLLAEKEFAELTLEHIIAHMPNHVYWKNIDGIYLGCNDKQAKSLGLKSGRYVIGKTDFDLPWKQEDAEAFRENDLEVIKTGKVITREEKAIVDNKDAIVLSQKVPLKDNREHIIGVLGISVDITELKQYQEKLKQANQSKSDFLRIISHELTAPVSNIINSLDIIKQQIEIDGFSKETIIDYLELAKQEAELIKPKLNDVINYINFDEDNVVSRKAGCNLAELILQVIEKNSAKKSNDVQIKYKADKKLSARIILDTEHLYIVLNIILSNAVKYTRQGTINISLERIVQPPDSVKITVTDTGSGIHAEQLKAILRGFHDKINNELYNRYQKPSVRLPYARLLVQHLLKGELIIESNLGGGTCVSITIPYEYAPCDASSTKSSQTKPVSFRALLVEDNDVSRRLEREMLKNLNCVVEEAATGNEALAKASEQLFDFIFLDITLPDMNGIQVFERLSETLCAQTPVIALTSHATEEDIGTFTDKGMLTVIAKPVSFEALKAFFDSYEKSLDD